MEHLDNQYATLSEAMNDLQLQGYTDELTLLPDGLFNVQRPMDPAEFKIDSYHRFEGPSDPGDLSILYAVSSEANDLKGLLVGNYGPEGQGLLQRMVQPLKIQQVEGKVKPVQPAEPGTNVKR
ncbi:MAG: phosphoribosylpyrophosphate synthetase [Flavobacteriales bacterium]